MVSRASYRAAIAMSCPHELQVGWLRIALGEAGVQVIDVRLIKAQSIENLITLTGGPIDLVVCVCWLGAGV